MNVDVATAVPPIATIGAKAAFRFVEISAAPCSPDVVSKL